MQSHDLCPSRRLASSSWHSTSVTRPSPERLIAMTSFRSEGTRSEQSRCDGGASAETRYSSNSSLSLPVSSCSRPIARHLRSLRRLPPSSRLPSVVIPVVQPTGVRTRASLGRCNVIRPHPGSRLQSMLGSTLIGRRQGGVSPASDRNRYDGIGPDPNRCQRSEGWAGWNYSSRAPATVMRPLGPPLPGPGVKLTSVSSYRTARRT